MDVLSDKSSDHSNEPVNSMSTSRTFVCCCVDDVVPGFVVVVICVVDVVVGVGDMEVVEVVVVVAVVARVVVSCVGMSEQFIQ